jgi:hypothetical protein
METSMSQDETTDNPTVAEMDAAIRFWYCSNAITITEAERKAMRAIIVASRASRRGGLEELQYD